MSVLEHLLRSPPSAEPTASISSWLARLEACPFSAAIDQAFWAGFEADRLGYAFVGGYQAALDRLLSSPGVPTRRCLAATESGGGHPRAIETKLETGASGQLVVRGEKTFATLASVADELLVVASRGTGGDGRNQLVLVRVRATAPGLTIEARPPTSFAPEIPHARVTLADVAVREEDVLPGDGYAVYLKPFRTVEDTHVLAAALGHLVRSARLYGFDRTFAEEAFALVLAVRAVASMNAGDPTAHIALAGIFGATRRLIANHDADWDKVDAETRVRWRRDLGLLVVAESTRQQRTVAAWKALGSSGVH